jgi:hypothetical protein
MHFFGMNIHFVFEHALSPPFSPYYSVPCVQWCAILCKRERESERARERERERETETDHDTDRQTETEREFTRNVFYTSLCSFSLLQRTVSPCIHARVHACVMLPRACKCKGYII